MTGDWGIPISIPTIEAFNRSNDRPLISPHDDPMVVELKVASAFVRRIMDCLKKLKHPGWDITPLVHLILGFYDQTVTPVYVIQVPLRFRDKAKSRNLEVDFLVMNVPLLATSSLDTQVFTNALPCSSSTRGRRRKHREVVWRPADGLRVLFSPHQVVRLAPRLSRGLDNRPSNEKAHD
ncbi:hypothetical protein Cgig2_025526 [Carnegiea gigantea]|uniref:Uncharacterized protein n=1 Tax=Carnegiea gigantea TaxID=171969 RepID=A0A9Q1KB78_9CARY|nr:hypothetical protein Cgig2_025526 [Carnegiea gigantea]